MKASVDTNVIIHLYKANLKTLLFERFEEILVYSFIRDIELQKHADVQVLNDFDTDVSNGKIKLIDNACLRQKRMYEIFEEHVYDNRLIYAPSDLGEVYAIALARTLGAISVVTDDIKKGGPHYLLLREKNSDIIPFAFYELMMLDFLEEKTTPEIYVKSFNRVNRILNNPMNIEKKTKNFILRFWGKNSEERDKQWIKKFCEKSKIVPKQKINELIKYINK